MGEMLGNWALYMKRELQYYESIFDYDEAISSKKQKTPQFILIDPDYVDWDDTKQIRSLQSSMENGVNLIFGKLPDVSVVSSHKLLRRLLGINEITSEHVTAEGIHLYGGFLLGGEAIYKAETEEEKSRP